jgi:hypothetical protein
VHSRRTSPGGHPTIHVRTCVLPKAICETQVQSTIHVSTPCSLKTTCSINYHTLSCVGLTETRKAAGEEEVPLLETQPQLHRYLDLLLMTVTVLNQGGCAGFQGQCWMLQGWC